MPHLELNPSLGIPIYRQLMDQIREQIAAGRLRAGDQLPSIRELASSLRINPASAVKAYGELRHLGIIVQDQGRGTFVNASVQTKEKAREELLSKEADIFVSKGAAWGCSPRELREALERALAGHAETHHAESGKEKS